MLKWKIVVFIVHFSLVHLVIQGTFYFQSYLCPGCCGKTRKYSLPLFVGGDLR